MGGKKVAKRLQEGCKKVAGGCRKLQTVANGCKKLQRVVKGLLLV